MSSTTIHLKVATRGNQHEPKVFRFERDKVSIGRLAENDLHLAHHSVAERHVTIAASSGTYWIVVNAKDHDTFLNNQRITQRGEAIEPDASVLRIGPYEITVLEWVPATTVEADLLAAIDQNPTDADVRSVYLDWLEEQGRHTELEFIRAQIEVRRLSPTSNDKKLRELSHAITMLADKLPLSWRRIVAQPVIEKCDLRYDLVCPKSWDALQSITGPNSKTERYCGACEKNVHYAVDVRAARLLARSGHCVAVDLAQWREPNDLDHEPVMMMGRIAAR